MQPLRPRMSFKMVLLVIRQQGISLCRHSLQLALTGSLGLRTLGVHLILKGLLTLLLGLGTVNVLNQSTLVLECVTLAQVVELVVEVLVDLAAGTVLDQEASEDSKAAHPEDLGGHTSVGSTLSLTESTVSAFSSGQVELAGAGSRVHCHRLSDNEAIGDELSDGLARVGV